LIKKSVIQHAFQFRVDTQLKFNHLFLIYFTFFYRWSIFYFLSANLLIFWFMTSPCIKLVQDVLENIFLSHTYEWPQTFWPLHTVLGDWNQNLLRYNNSSCILLLFFTDILVSNHVVGSLSTALCFQFLVVHFYFTHCWRTLSMLDIMYGKIYILRSLVLHIWYHLHFLSVCCILLSGYLHHARESICTVSGGAK
jgi:hypothetical protein